MFKSITGKIVILASLAALVAGLGVSAALGSALSSYSKEVLVADN